MATRKTPSKPKTAEPTALETEATPPVDETVAAAPIAEPAKKSARKKAAKAPVEPAPESAVAATPETHVGTPATTPVLAPETHVGTPTAPALAQKPAGDDRIRLRTAIAARAYALYRAGSRDTFRNWLLAEREVLGR